MFKFQKFKGQIRRGNFYVSRGLFLLGFVAFSAVRCRGFGDMHPTLSFRRLEHNAHFNCSPFKSFQPFNRFAPFKPFTGVIRFQKFQVQRKLNPSKSFNRSALFQNV